MTTTISLIIASLLGLALGCFLSWLTEQQRIKSNLAYANQTVRHELFRRAKMAVERDRAERAKAEAQRLKNDLEFQAVNAYLTDDYTSGDLYMKLARRESDRMNEYDTRLNDLRRQSRQLVFGWGV